MIRSWKKSNTLREAESYQARADLFKQQMDHLMHEISNVMDTKHVSEENKEVLQGMIDTLTNMRDGAQTDPEEFNKRQKRFGGFRGENLLPEEFKPVFIRTEDYDLQRELKRKMDPVALNMAKGRSVRSYTYSVDWDCSFYYNGRFYRIYEVTVSGRDIHKSAIGAVVEYAIDEVKDWRYLSTYKSAEVDYKISKHPATREFLDEVKADPSILADYVDETEALLSK